MFCCKLKVENQVIIILCKDIEQPFITLLMYFLFHVHQVYVMSHRCCVLMQKMAIVFERAYVCIVEFIKMPVYILTYIKSMYECVD